MRYPESLHRRQAVHAGSFYPADGQEIQDLFEDWAAEPKVIPELIGLILPHAGYAYSGPTAARGYTAIPGNIRRILLLGPSHRNPVRGLAVWNEGPWETPLGEVEIGRDATESLLKTGIFHPDPRPFLPEHSLEVHMPFLKHFLPAATLVPMIAGTIDSGELEEVAEAIRKLLDGETVIIASSDLYHGHSYEECVAQDTETLSLIKRLNGKAFLLAAKQRRVMACGDNAIAVLLETAAGISGSEAEVLEYTNSAEVTGNRGGYVVGYAAVAVNTR